MGNRKVEEKKSTAKRKEQVKADLKPPAPIPPEDPLQIGDIEVKIEEIVEEVIDGHIEDLTLASIMPDPGS